MTNATMPYPLERLGGSQKFITGGMGHGAGRDKRPLVSSPRETTFGLVCALGP